MADADLQIKIVTTLDGKGAADAKRDIEAVGVAAKSAAKGAEAETSKWVLSKQSLVANVKALKHELSTLPYFGQLFAVLRNPVVLLGAGIAAIVSKARELNHEINELQKPIDNVFGPRTFGSVERLNAQISHMAASAKTVVSEVNEELERLIGNLAIAQGPGKVPLPGEREALSAAMQAQLGIGRAAMGELGQGRPIVLAAQAKEKAEAALAKAVNASRLGGQREQLQQFILTGNRGALLRDPLLYDELSTKRYQLQREDRRWKTESAEYYLKPAALALLGKYPSKGELRRRVDQAQAVAGAAGAQLESLAPGVGSLADARKFIVGREAAATERAQAAYGAAGDLQGRIESLDANASRAREVFNQKFQEDMGIRDPYAGHGVGPAIMGPQGWSTGQAWKDYRPRPMPGSPLSNERNRLQGHQVELGVELSRLLFSQSASNEQSRALIEKLIQENNDNQVRLKTLERQIRNGDR